MKYTITPEQQELINKTRESMARELRAWILTPEALSIKATKREDLIKYHHSLGRAIRNEFELWLPEHEITSIWIQWSDNRIKDPDAPTSLEMALSDGRRVKISSSKPIDADDHPCHPDNFSFSVIERLWELYQERKEESL